MRCVLVFLCIVATLPARRDPVLCGTTPETPRERLFFHARARTSPRRRASSNNRDVGNLAIVEDTGGVVARQNEFNLDLKTLRFTPAGSTYSYTVLDGGFDGGAASQGAPLAALDDDDTRAIALPF